MQPVHERGKIAAWIAPPRQGINGQPFDYRVRPSGLMPVLPGKRALSAARRAEAGTCHAWQVPA